MKKHILAVLGLFFLSWVVAILVTPADPVTMLSLMALILLIVLPAYAWGLCNGRRTKNDLSAGVVQQKETATS